MGYRKIIKIIHLVVNCSIYSCITANQDISYQTVLLFALPISFLEQLVEYLHLVVEKLSWQFKVFFSHKPIEPIGRPT